MRDDLQFYIIVSISIGDRTTLSRTITRLKSKGFWAPNKLQNVVRLLNVLMIYPQIKPQRVRMTFERFAIQPAVLHFFKRF